MIRKWHHFATAFIIAQSLQAFGIIDRDLWGEWSGKGGDKLTQSLNLMMIAVSLALYCRGRKRLSSIRSGATLTLGLAVFLLSSIIWSINPAGTLTQGVVYLAVAIGAIGIATNLDIDEFMKLLATVCGLAALSSLLLMVAAPSQVFTSEGDYRGIFSQKNILGEAMMVGALASLHGLRATSRQRLCNGAILALVMIACILSKSTTSLSTILVRFDTKAWYRTHHGYPDDDYRRPAPNPCYCIPRSGAGDNGQGSDAYRSDRNLELCNT
jgi:hypothetical protein